MNLFQVVELIKEVPGCNLKKGDRGVIVEIFNSPYLAYEVEFVDQNGRTIEEIALTPDFIRLCSETRGDVMD